MDMHLWASSLTPPHIVGYKRTARRQGPTGQSQSCVDGTGNDEGFKYNRTLPA